MLKVTAGALAAAPLISVGEARAGSGQAARTGPTPPSQPRPRFFTPDEFALADELTEMIIPADDHSPGARGAHVAEYIDNRLAESWGQLRKQMWRDGLKTIDATSVEMHGKPFLEAAPEQRIAVLTRISQNETNPQK